MFLSCVIVIVNVCCLVILSCILVERILFSDFVVYASECMHVMILSCMLVSVYYLVILRCMFVWDEQSTV